MTGSQTLKPPLGSSLNRPAWFQLIINALTFIGTVLVFAISAIVAVMLTAVLFVIGVMMFGAIRARQKFSRGPVARSAGAADGPILEARKTPTGWSISP